jgi:asparagine synthase (glutamine-hydrolysing)
MYLPDDILTKVDRASMSVGLEARVPVLDHRVVGYALSMPLEFSWHGGQTKAPLREILYKRVPRQLIERPKRGFGIPVADLLATDIPRWTRHYLSRDRIGEEGLLDAGAVTDWLEHSRLDNPVGIRSVWFLLCFERWYAKNHRGEEAD